MVQHKAQLKKQQKRGVDFKKIKRKIGRKLPPPKNTTNTEVKSKAIILPEQSLASEKGGLAVSKKGLTLKELLQQTSHHNAKVRRDALIGMRDIFLKHPPQLKMHRLSVIEKLRERISDEDKIVRETLYQLLKAVIFPACCKEENQGTFISLMMAYVFNAMTHLAFDVRLMAFKFFDLLVQHYPISFSMYAEKIIQHYKEILQKNQFNLHDKGKLKSVLAGLAYCLSLLPMPYHNTQTENATVADPRVLHAFESQVHEDRSAFPVTAKELMGLLPILVGGLEDFMPSLETQSFDCLLSILKSIHLVVKFFVYGNGTIHPKVSSPSNRNRRDEDVLQMLLNKLFTVFPLNPTHQSSEKEDNRYFILNVIVSEIFFCLSDWSAPPSVFLEKFLLFLVDALSEKVCGSGKAFFQKHSLPLIPFIPKLIMQVDDTWKSHILQGFTEVFNKCDPESSMKLVCLSAIEEMLLPKRMSNERNDSEMLKYEISWIREIPLLLRVLGDKNPLLSKAVLRVQLELGQLSGGIIKSEFDSMQLSLRDFYSTTHDGDILFMKLPREIQEVCISCLYYFSSLDSSLLQSVAACCLCVDLDPFVLFRLLEVVKCGYRAGHIQIADYISFLITLLSRYTVFPENSAKSNSGLFRSLTRGVCCCLSEIGDDHLLLKMVEGTLIHQISKSNDLPLGLENTCALLRMIATLDSNPTTLSQESISKLGNLLPGYLLHVVSNVGEEEDGRRGYYVLPCFVFLCRSEGIVNDVLKVMRRWTCEKASSNSSKRRIIAVVGVLLLMHDEDVRRGAQIFKKIAAKEQIDSILHNISRVMSDDDDEYKLNMEEKHKIQYAYDRLKIIIGG